MGGWAAPIADRRPPEAGSREADRHLARSDWVGVAWVVVAVAAMSPGAVELPGRVEAVVVAQESAGVGKLARSGGKAARKAGRGSKRGQTKAEAN